MGIKSGALNVLHLNQQAAEIKELQAENRALRADKAYLEREERSLGRCIDKLRVDAHQLEDKFKQEKYAQEERHSQDLEEVEDLMAIGYDILKEKLVTSIELAPGPEWWQLPAFLWRQKIMVLIKASVWEGGRPQRPTFKPGTVINWAFMK